MRSLRTRLSEASAASAGGGGSSGNGVVVFDIRTFSSRFGNDDLNVSVEQPKIHARQMNEASSHHERR
jgi:hypothetical protein